MSIDNVSRHEKIKALLHYELMWLTQGKRGKDVSDVTDYVMALINTYSDSCVDRLFKNKLPYFTEEKLK